MKIGGTGRQPKLVDTNGSTRGGDIAVVGNSRSQLRSAAFGAAIDRQNTVDQAKNIKRILKRKNRIDFIQHVLSFQCKWISEVAVRHSNGVLLAIARQIDND